jgi:PQQ-dependent dehydrogenase (methanol/ethanol family)
MSLGNDRAVEAARNIELQEVDDGYTLVGGPEESVTHQHSVQDVPEVDVTQEMLTNSGQNPEAWLMYGGNYEQHRHTTADVITPENVSDLQLEHELSVGAGSSMEGTPIVVPGDPPVMYQTNGPNHIKAINARDGEVLWSYTYAPPRGVLLCCDDNNRGAAVFGDMVYMTTLDSGVVALDRYTGEERWHVSTADHEVGYSATWAPVVYDGKVITGSAGGEYGVRGFIMALDAESGEEVWRTHTNPPEEWIGDTVEQGSGTSWMTPTIDVKNNRLYSPVGNPGPDFDGTVRPGPNRNTCGTISMSTDDGSFQWSYQESPHDIWDYDSAAPRMLIRDLDVGGETADSIFNFGKTGWGYSLQAEDGRLRERTEEGVQHLNMWRMIPHVSEDRRVAFVPGAQGGTDWQPPAYNPENGLVYGVMQNAPQDMFWQFHEYEAGEAYWGGGLDDPPAEPPEGWNENTSAVVAFDPATGERVWREWIQSDHYIWGGLMTTATGLTFTGTQTGDFVAYDGESGDRLWQFEFDVPICASPMSWYDPGEEKQYVAVQVGGSGWLRQGPRGNTLAVFSMEA